MKYWLDIKAQLKSNIEISIQLLLLLLGIYVMIMSDNERIWKVPLLFVGAFIWFFYRGKTKHPIALIVFSTLLIIDLCYLYFRVANHHFMLLFMVLPVIGYSYHQRIEILSKNMQFLLVIVIMTSVIQKLLSSQFMSGDFYYYMMNRGGMFSRFINFFPENLDVIKENKINIIALNDTNPNDLKTIVLKDIFKNLGFMSLVFAWVTVIVESIVAISILWKPRSTWVHILFTFMIIGILCTRLETGFMALLAICGLILCNNSFLRLVYVLIVLGCITLIVTKIGFH
ncbi:hypothetical protein [Winogradskyella vidalii]|uniref:hypothetical protein n=1 Tax=Winogradskyella vidalii TaxID=2615024 RepID=UPI0015C7C5A6|nr:hypothetical protein [Winogradskyella vidalii]